MNIVELKPGHIVEHKLGKDWLMVLSVSLEDETVTCRTKSFGIYDFFDFELQAQSR